MIIKAICKQRAPGPHLGSVCVYLECAHKKEEKDLAGPGMQSYIRIILTEESASQLVDGKTYTVTLEEDANEQGSKPKS